MFERSLAAVQDDFIFFSLSPAFLSCLPYKCFRHVFVFMFQHGKLIFLGLKHEFLGVQFVFLDVEHNFFRHKDTFYFRFHQINRAEFNKK